MLRPAATQLISKNDSYYSLVIGVAKRAREIADELDKEGKVLEEKPVKTAVEELAAGKFRIEEYTGKNEEETETEQDSEQTEDVLENSDGNEEAQETAEAQTNDNTDEQMPGVQQPFGF